MSLSYATRQSLSLSLLIDACRLCSQDDTRLEATRELYRSVGEDASGQPVHETPGFCAMLQYVLQRIDATPRSRWRDVANTPVPYSLKVMDEVRQYEGC